VDECKPLDIGVPAGAGVDRGFDRFQSIERKAANSGRWKEAGPGVK
jgi:hypothetical protein